MSFANDFRQACRSIGRYLHAFLLLQLYYGHFCRTNARPHKCRCHWASKLTHRHHDAFTLDWHEHGLGDADLAGFWSGQPPTVWPLPEQRCTDLDRILCYFSYCALHLCRGFIFGYRAGR